MMHCTTWLLILALSVLLSGCHGEGIYDNEWLIAKEYCEEAGDMVQPGDLLDANVSVLGEHSMEIREVGGATVANFTLTNENTYQTWATFDHDNEAHCAFVNFVTGAGAAPYVEVFVRDNEDNDPCHTVITGSWIEDVRDDLGCGAGHTGGWSANN